MEVFQLIVRIAVPLLGVLSAVISAVISYRKSKDNTALIRFQTIIERMKQLAVFAEAHFDKGEQKRDYVFNRLKTEFGEIDEEAVEAKLTEFITQTKNINQLKGEVMTEQDFQTLKAIVGEETAKRIRACENVSLSMGPRIIDDAQGNQLFLEGKAFALSVGDAIHYFEAIRSVTYAI